MSISSFLQTVPDPKKLEDFNKPGAVLIYDKHGILLYNSYKNTYRIPIKIKSVPSILIDGTLAAEDKRFYNHGAIDPLALLRVLIYDIRTGRMQGGSTITQQLAKNSFLTNEKTIARKIKEVIIAYRIESNFTKDQILELYFNNISYGGDSVGIEAASQKYFKKNVSELTDKEAIFLASLPAAPSYLLTKDAILVKERMKFLLDQLERSKKISSKQRQKIDSEKLELEPAIVYKRAPHAVDYVLTLLRNKYGNDLYRKGMVVETTIDLSLQNYIQQEVIDFVAKNKINNVTNAAVIVIDPKDGSILSMVGSANYFDGVNGQYNVITAKRQPGSAIKIATYALAIEKGLSPDSKILDEPTVFKNNPEYKPHNYDNKFHGLITLKEALANSYNIPALKLADSLGIEKVAEMGRKMGIEEFNRPTFPLSLAIGGVEVSLKNLSQAYSVVANEGLYKSNFIIRKIYDDQGKKDYENPQHYYSVFSQSTGQKLFDILSDKSARRAMFGEPSDFNFEPYKIAVKTGTSNDMKDNLAVSFSRDLVVAVWIGNSNGESMTNVASGSLGASEIMHKVTEKLLTDQHEQVNKLHAER